MARSAFYQYRKMGHPLRLDPAMNQVRAWRRIRGELGQGAENAIREAASMNKARLNQNFISRGLYDTTRRPVELGQIDRRMGQDIAQERSRIGLAAIRTAQNIGQSEMYQSNWERARQDRLRLQEQARQDRLAAERRAAERARQPSPAEAEQLAYLQAMANGSANVPQAAPTRAKPPKKAKPKKQKARWTRTPGLYPSGTAVL